MTRGTDLTLQVQKVEDSTKKGRAHLRGWDGLDVLQNALYVCSLGSVADGSVGGRDRFVGLFRGKISMQEMV